MSIRYYLVVFLFGWCSQLTAQEVIGVVKNAADDKPISTVHVLNLNKVLMSITDANGVFAIDAEVNDTLFLSYLGFKTIKVTVTNDLIKFPKTEFKLTALALALEEVVVRPYQLTGYLEIDAKNVPINRNQRYSIPGLPTGGYEVGSRGPSAFSRVVGSIFNPFDFLHNLFGKKPNELRKLKKMRENNTLRDLLSVKYDRETLEEFLQLNISDIDEILRNCNFSESFIRTANDLQILEAISGCYEEYKILSRR
ncbi:MAG: carboxypeptidase-like regulatory domain-containing protein [Flavobacteriaceae bacterium]